MAKRLVGGGFSRASISSASTGINLILTMLIVLIASRQEQFGAIASYSVGLSTGAIASVAVGGGTTLAFTRGSIVTQSFVRHWRKTVVLPVLFVVAVVATVTYSATTELEPVAILLGASTAIFNNLSEIEAAYLRRKLKTPSMLAADFASKSLGLLIVSFGLSFAWAMATAALLRLVFLFQLAFDDPSRRIKKDLDQKALFRTALKPGLFGTSILFASIDRFIFIIIPFTTDPTTAGQIAVLLSAQQALSGALSNGLMTVMAARSESKRDHTWARKFEAFTVVLSVAFAALGICLSELMFEILNVPYRGEIVLCWNLLCFVVPAAVCCRLVQYRLIGSHKEFVAFWSLFAGFSVQIILSFIGIAQLSVVLLVLALLASETISTALGLLLSRRKWQSRSEAPNGLP